MKSLFKIAIIPFALSLFFTCTKKDPNLKLKDMLSAHAETDINQFILDKFKDHRIVILDNDRYDEGLYTRRILSFLNGWFEAAKADKNLPREMVLVLEEDSLLITRIYKYIGSHKFLDLVDEQIPYNPYMTTADMDFYWRLGDLIKEIDNYKSNGGDLKLTILGPEKPYPFEGQTAAARDSFYIYDKDQISSNAIINYLKPNPARKALVFYGQERLIKGKTLKKAATMQADGYYMAHYLSQEFGNGVYIIGQKSLLGMSRFSESFFALDLSYVIETKYIPESIARPEIMFDATIVSAENPGLAVNLAFVQSETLGYLALNQIKMIFSKKYHFRWMMGNIAAEYLSILTGQMQCLGYPGDTSLVEATIPEWESWLNDPQSDVVKDIDTAGPYKRLLSLMGSTRDDNVGANCSYFFRTYSGQFGNYDLRLARNGVQDEIDYYKSASNEDSASLIERYQNYLNDSSNRIIITDLVQLLWVGTEEECQEAVAELQKRTGESFTTAPEWMKWWRENYEKL